MAFICIRVVDTTRVQNNRCDADGWIYRLIKILHVELFS